jgi:hypothetical protein
MPDTNAHAHSCRSYKGNVANRLLCSAQSIRSLKGRRAARFRVMLITLIFAFCSTLFNLPGSIALLRRQECGITNIKFLTFLPCLQEFGRALPGKGVASIFEQLDSCDLLTRAAVELAVERANRNWRNASVTVGNYQRFLSLIPLHGVSDSVGTRDLPAVSHQVLLNL